jgi:hypothetical protein
MAPTLNARRKHKPLRVPVRMDQLDAAENAFFGQALEQVKAQTYDRKLPQFKARSFIPIDPTIDRDTESMIVRSYDMVGQARLLASYADDLPRADVFSTEQRVQFRPIGTSYGYSLFEVRAAAKAGVALDQKKAMAARRTVESLIDRVLAKGDAATGLVGLLNQPNATTYAVPNGAGGSPAWADKTPKEIVDDLIGICEEIIDSTNEVESPNMILIPRAQMTILRTTQFSLASDKTILEWFRANYGGQVGIDTWHRLQGAGAGGTDRMVAYTMSPDHLQGAVPQEFEQLPVQERNLEFIIPCHARVGGVLAYYPLSIAYGDGI